MVLNPEGVYNALILDASNKHASWDPEIPLKVGDWGRLVYRRKLLVMWSGGVVVGHVRKLRGGGRLEKETLGFLLRARRLVTQDGRHE